VPNASRRQTLREARREATRAEAVREANRETLRAAVGDIPRQLAHLHVIQLVVRRVELAQQIARVITAPVPAVTSTPLAKRDSLHIGERHGGTGLSEALVIGDVSCEAAQPAGGAASARRIGRLAEAAHERGESVGALGPSKPSSVAGIEVEGCVRCLRVQRLQCVVEALDVRGLRGGVAAARLVEVGCHIRQRVGLEDDDRGHLCMRLEHRGEGIDVLGLVLGEPDPARGLARVVVACGAVLVVLAAHLAVGRERVAIAIGKVI